MATGVSGHEERIVLEWTRRLFRCCLLLLLSAVALCWTIGLIRYLLPWLARAGLAVGAGWALWRWVRRGRDRW